MNKKDKKAQVKRVRAAIEKWRQVLGMDEWRLIVNYVPGALRVNGHLDEEADACTNTQWEYRQATISFNLESIFEYDDDEVDAIVLHEMFHVVVAEMEAKNRKSEERVVTTLAVIAQRIAGMAA